MNVTIKRKTGWLGLVSRIIIKVNGKKVAKIRSSQEVNLNLQNDSAYLTVTQFGSKSNEIEITDGDTVEITSTIWSYIFYYSMLTFVLIMNISAYSTSITFTMYTTFLVFGFILFMVSFFLVNTYLLKIVDNKSLK